MKTISFAILLLFLFSLHSLAQTVTNKDLIGTWKPVDSKNDAVWIFDGSNFVNSSSRGEASPIPYVIDNSHYPAVLHLYKKVTADLAISMYFLIKIDNNHILKMQGGSESIPASWIEKETSQNTGTFIKLK